MFSILPNQSRNIMFFFFSSRRRHTRFSRDWSSDVCSSDLGTTRLGSSTSGTSTEQVNLVNPAAGADYHVYVHGFATANNAPSPFKLYTWLLGSSSAGNMTVTAPSTATTGATGTISLSFSGLAAATKYLGSVAYSGASGMPNPTIVRVDTP